MNLERRDEHVTMAVENYKMDCDCVDESATKPEYSGITEIIFVRHGETICNASGIFQGQSESELNELGWRQANAVAERLAKEPNISALYSSDLKRALDTATTIGQKCGLQVKSNTAWRERHLGKLQGLSRKEAALLEPLVYQAFVSHDKDRVIPLLQVYHHKDSSLCEGLDHMLPYLLYPSEGIILRSQGEGESINQLYLRSKSALEEITNNHRGERVIVVTHGGVLRALWKFVGERSSPGKVLNTSINVIRRYENGGWAAPCWGDTTHLNGVGFLSSGFGGDSQSG